MVAKGVLLEIEGGKGVVLTPQGEFKRVPVPKGVRSIGEEIDFTDAPASPWARWGLTAAAAALVFLVAPLGYQSWALAQPVAYVTVDINPSLQLTLNKRDNVIRVEGLNQDGTLLLQKVDWKGQPVDTVVSRITDEAVAEHKLDPADEAGAVVVAVAPAKEQDLPKDLADRIRDKAEQAVHDAVTAAARHRKVEPRVSVAGLEATAKDQQDAQALGLSPGKLLLLKEIQQEDPSVTPDQIRAEGPGKVLKELGISPGEIFGKAEEHHGGDGAQVRPANGKAGEGPSDKGNSGSQPAGDQPKQPGNKDHNGSSSNAPDQNRQDQNKQDLGKPSQSQQDQDRKDREKQDQSKPGQEKQSDSHKDERKSSDDNKPRTETSGAAGSSSGGQKDMGNDRANGKH